MSPAGMYRTQRNRSLNSNITVAIDYIVLKYIYGNYKNMSLIDKMK